MSLDVSCSASSDIGDFSLVATSSEPKQRPCLDQKRRSVAGRVKWFWRTLPCRGSTQPPKPGPSFGLLPGRFTRQNGQEGIYSLNTVVDRDICSRPVGSEPRHLPTPSFGLCSTQNLLHLKSGGCKCRGVERT